MNWIAAAACALVLAACGKPPTPKVDAAVEREAATERAKERAYGGDAMKALEKAKAFEADVNKLATDAVEKAEKGTN